MSDSRAENLNAQFRALHAERERTWAPAQLAKNVETRKGLVAAFDPDTIVKVGDKVEYFALQTSTGGVLSLSELTADGPLVLIFFRFAGCPACNLALPYYDRELVPALARHGATLLAVSPHLADKGLDDIRVRHDLRFTIASDTHNELARRFNISFARGSVPDGQPSPGWIGELTGTGTAELPQAAVVIIDQTRTVRFVDVSPDWLVRTEAPQIIEAVERIGAEATV